MIGPEARMMHTLARNWVLLAACAALDAVLSAVYLWMQSGGPVTFHSWGNAIALQGKLALAAGVCSLGAGLWRSGRGKCWPLVVNGLALIGLGVIQSGLAARYRVSFLVVAGLVIAMAVSSGGLDLMLARVRRLGGHATDGRLLAGAGWVSAGFVVLFVALALRWIPMGPESHPDLLSLGCFFGFSAVWFGWMAVRMHGVRAAG